MAEEYINISIHGIKVKDADGDVYQLSASTTGQITPEGGEIFNDYENNLAGKFAHAEGINTRAEGFATHASGLNTTATGFAQTVVGKYNRTFDKALFIVGNGDDFAYSNIMTVLPNEVQIGDERDGTSVHINPEQIKIKTDFESIILNHNGLECTSSLMPSGIISAKTIKANGYELPGQKITSGGEIFNSYDEERNEASGIYSHAEGRQTKAIGQYSHAEGWGTEAFGKQSHSEGNATKALGDYSHVEGNQTVAKGWCQHVHGRKNIQDTNHTYLTIVGNSTDTPSNAYTLDWAGRAEYAGSIGSMGADYAEYFEWEDGNLLKEDRIGYIVALNEDKIHLAQPGEEMLGIITGTAMVVGDNAEWEWRHKYLVDNFGRRIYENTTIEENNESFTIQVPKINPEYNPEQEYIRRADRPEWSTVGLMGKLHVRDDGTCIPNGYATIGVNGIATYSFEKTNMRVMKRITDNVVLVLLK